MALASYNWPHDDLLGSFINPFPANVASASHRGSNGEANIRGIPLDVIEKKNCFEIKADVPGVNKSDIKLSVDGDVLSLSVQKTAAKEDKKEQEGWKLHRMERSQTWVRRSLRLPEHADLAKVAAKYTDGVLLVSVPKSEEKARSHTVQVE